MNLMKALSLTTFVLVFASGCAKDKGNSTPAGSSESEHQQLCRQAPVHIEQSTADGDFAIDETAEIQLCSVGETEVAMVPAGCEQKNIGKILFWEADWAAKDVTYDCPGIILKNVQGINSNKRKVRIDQVTLFPTAQLEPNQDAEEAGLVEKAEEIAKMIVDSLDGSRKDVSLSTLRFVNTQYDTLSENLGEEEGTRENIFHYMGGLDVFVAPEPVEAEETEEGEEPSSDETESEETDTEADASEEAPEGEASEEEAVEPAPVEPTYVLGSVAAIVQPEPEAEVSEEETTETDPAADDAENTPADDTAAE